MPVIPAKAGIQATWTNPSKRQNDACSVIPGQRNICMTPSIRRNRVGPRESTLTLTLSFKGEGILTLQTRVMLRSPQVRTFFRR